MTEKIAWMEKEMAIQNKVIEDLKNIQENPSKPPVFYNSIIFNRIDSNE